MKKYAKFLLIIVAAITVVYFMQVGKNTYRYETVPLKKGKISQIVTASGIIDPISTVIVGTQVSGTIKEIYVDYNSKVKKGEMLALIDPDLFAATVEQRKAALEIAKALVEVQQNNITYYSKTLERIKKLNSSRYSSQKELEAAQRDYDNAVAQLKLQKAQVKQDKAYLNSAETELRYTKIKSPVDGIVISKSVEVGQTVAASFSTPELFTVAEDLTQMEIDTSVVEADIAKVKEGQKVRFSVDSFPDKYFDGTVKQVRNEAITNSNVVTYSVIIGIENPDLVFKPGMTANVEIITDEKEDALLVPNQALRFYMDSGKRYKEKGIWLLRNGLPQRVAITEGLYDDNFTEVISEDLEEGDKVIVAKNSNNPKQQEKTRLRMPR